MPFTDGNCGLGGDMDEHTEEQLELAELERDDVEDAHVAEVERQRSAFVNDESFDEDDR